MSLCVSPLLHVHNLPITDSLFLYFSTFFCGFRLFLSFNTDDRKQVSSKGVRATERISASPHANHLEHRREKISAPHHLLQRNDGARPRYSDSIVPLKEDTTYSRRAASDNRASLPTARQSVPAIPGRPLQRVISLSNVFDESVQHHQPQPARQVLHSVQPHPSASVVGQQRGRPRSFSDTSIYARSDPAGYPTDAQLPYKGGSQLTHQFEDDEESVEYVKEDQYGLHKVPEQTKTLGGKTGSMEPKNGHAAIEDVEDPVIGLTEFGKQEKIIVEKQ
jgi:hypothetical protein